MPNDAYYSEKWKDSPIELGVIQDVVSTAAQESVPGSPGETREEQIQHFCCTVVTASSRILLNVPWISPYVNPRTGSGINFIPKPRTQVVVAYVRKGQPVIIGFLVPSGNTGSYGGERNSNPGGSIELSTDGGAELLLQDGGVIRIQSTATCKRTMIPFGDQIRDFCRNYFLITAGGEVTFTESRDGQRLTALRIEAFEKGGAKGESVRLQMGSHGESDPDPQDPPGKIFSLIVAKKTKIYIGKNGRLKIENHQADGDQANDISISSDGKFTIANGKSIDVRTQDGAILIQAGPGGHTKVAMDKDGAIQIESPSQITIKAPMVQLDADTVITKGRTLLAQGGLPVARVFDPIICETSDGPKPGYITGGSSDVFSG